MPIIAGAISKRIFIEGTKRNDKEIRINLPDIKNTESITFNGLLEYNKERDYYRSSLNVLMKEGFTYYQEDHVDKLIVYTHRFAPSRSFYLNLGGQIIKSETQLNGQLIIDIFSFDLEVLTQKLENKLKRIKTLNQTVLK